MLGLRSSLLILAVAGCSTATIDTAWRAPSGPTLTNVVTLSPAAEVSIRRAAEDALAQQLARHGVRAVPAYSVLSDQTLDDPNHIAAALSEQGFDGLVSMRMVSAGQQLVYYPGFNDYWGGAWGSVVPTTIVRMEVNAYSLPSKKLMWSAMSQSTDPDSARQAIGDVSKLAGDQLAQAHVIAPTQAATR
jgi:hypothetical protein